MVSVQATGTFLESEQAIIGTSFLSINNSIGSDGTASIDFNFKLRDFTANGTAIRKLLHERLFFAVLFLVFSSNM
jgi:hypothetical protein